MEVLFSPYVRLPEKNRSVANTFQSEYISPVEWSVKPSLLVTYLEYLQHRYSEQNQQGFLSNGQFRWETDSQQRIRRR